MTMEHVQEILVKVQFNMTTRSLGENLRLKSEFQELTNFKQEIRTTFPESIGSHFGLVVWIRGTDGSREVIASNVDLKDAIYNTKKKKFLFYAERSLEDIGTPEIENRLRAIETEISGLKNEVGILRGEVGFLRGDVENLRFQVQNHLAMCRVTGPERASSLRHAHVHSELVPADTVAFPMGPTMTSGYEGGAMGEAWQYSNAPDPTGN